MTREYDILMRNAPKNSETRQYLSGATVVAADNVARYLLDTEQGSTDDIGRLPCVMPPFEKTWIEEKKVGCGWLMTRYDLKQNVHVWSPDMHEDSRYLCGGFFFSEHYPEGPIARSAMCLDEHGQPLTLNTGHWYSINPVIMTDHAMWKMDHVGISLGFSLHVAYWAMAFMHVDKVEIIDQEPNSKQSKRHQKRYKAPLCEWKTIRVTAINEDKSRDPQGGTHSSPREHIVRGHFRDYRFGAGLFGKHQGIYW